MARGPFPPLRRVLSGLALCPCFLLGVTGIDGALAGTHLPAVPQYFSAARTLFPVPAQPAHGRSVLAAPDEPVVVARCPLALPALIALAECDYGLVLAAFLSLAPAVPVLARRYFARGLGDGLGLHLGTAPDRSPGVSQPLPARHLTNDPTARRAGALTARARHPASALPWPSASPASTPASRRVHCQDSAGIRGRAAWTPGCRLPRAASAACPCRFSTREPFCPLERVIREIIISPPWGIDLPLCGGYGGQPAGP